MHVGLWKEHNHCREQAVNANKHIFYFTCTLGTSGSFLLNKTAMSTFRVQNTKTICCICQFQELKHLAAGTFRNVQYSAKILKTMSVYSTALKRSICQDQVWVLDSYFMYKARACLLPLVATKRYSVGTKIEALQIGQCCNDAGDTITQPYDVLGGQSDLAQTGDLRQSGGHFRKAVVMKIQEFQSAQAICNALVNAVQPIPCQLQAPKAWQCRQSDRQDVTHLRKAMSGQIDP